MPSLAVEPVPDGCVLAAVMGRLGRGEAERNWTLIPFRHILGSAAPTRIQPAIARGGTKGLLCNMATHPHAAFTLMLLY